MGQPASPITQVASNPFQGAAQAMQVAGGTLGNIAQGGANPATQQFIQRTQQNMLRQQQMQQNQLDAQASRAGAFGGSRHGVAQAQMIDDYSRRMGDMAAQQNLQAQQQAMNAASSLAGIGGQAFGMGQNIANMTAAQGQFTRGLQQQLADAAKQQYYGTTGFPTQGVQNIAGVLGGLPYGTSTTQRTPFDPTTLLAALI